MKLHRPSFRSLSRQLGPRPRPSPRLSCSAISATVAAPQGRVSCARTNESRRGYAAVSAGDLRFGQPVHETHPHILQAGELTPGITAQEYADRRAALADALPEGAVAILQAASIQYKSGAVFHAYRQESNFLWLTGWEEPEAVAVIRKTGPNLGDYTFYMFVQPKSPREEQWNGYRNGVQAAEDVFNADESYSIDSAGSMLPEITGGASSIYTDIASTATTSRFSWRSLLTSRPSSTPLAPVVHKLRAIKSPAEVANMRHAGQMSGRAITEAMRRGWTKEKELHAFLDYQFIMNGCDGPAYIPVVAGGERANCIHYTINNDVLREDEFILVDAGGQYGTYITDISRTWPASGKFTAAQRDLYEAVLKVQRSSVSLCTEASRMSLEDIHNVTARGLVDQLRAIGFDVNMNNISLLFPHHVGHYIGLDVHDCPTYSRRELLRAGHCVTVEPGIYVPDSEQWPKHFRGMGVRIEDSICVDTDSPYILTTEAVKEISDIEALRN